MKWVTWRQYRLEIIISLAVLVVLAAFFIPMGLVQLSLFHRLGLANLSPDAANYGTLSSEFLGTYPWLNGLATLINFSVLIGALFAVPIVLEFEQRTYRLAWTQSVTRGRWLMAKLGFALAATIIFSSLLALLMNWLLAPENQLNGPFNNFNVQGIVPVAYAVFTLTVALVVGTLSRRTAPAVLAALVVFIVTSTIIGNGLRPHYMTPLQHTTPVTMSSQGVLQYNGQATGDIPVPDSAWRVDQYFVDASGQLLGRVVQGMDATKVTGLVVKYQPASRYWPFQGIESSIYLALSEFALGVTVWAVKRRFR